MNRGLGAGLKPFVCRKKWACRKKGLSVMVDRVFALLVLSSLFAVSPARSEVLLRLTAVGEMAFADRAVAILTKAYEQLNVRFQVTNLPANKSILAVENGSSDGEVARIKDIGFHFTEIVRVDMPILSLKIYTYVNDPQLAGLTLHQLQDYRIGHVAGAKFAEQLTAGFPEVAAEKNSRVLFNRLQLGQLDAVIVSAVVGDKRLQEFSGKVFKSRQPVSTREFYHYLHRRHTALVAPLEEALRNVLMQRGMSAVQ